VQERHQGLSKIAQTSTYYFNERIYFTDAKGKEKSKYNNGEATINYNLFKDSRSAKLAGVIKVVQAKTGAILINHQIAETAQDQIEYADDLKARHSLNPNDVYIDLDDRLEILIDERKELMDVDTLAREMIDSIAGQMSYKILSALDKTPLVPDPTNLGLKEPMTRK